MLREVEGERDHALAVLTGVAVVCLDHVAQDQGGAAVGARELEHALQPPAALVGEGGEQAEQRDHGHRGERRLVDTFGRQQPRRGQRRIDGVDPVRADHRGKPGLPAERRRERGGRRVDQELGEQRGGQQQRTGIPRLGVGERQHRHRTEREPGVHQRVDQPARPDPPDGDIRQQGDRERGGHRERHDCRRHREHQRHEGELGGDREAERCVEAHAHGEGEDEQADDRRADRKGVGRLDGPDNGYGGEESRRRQAGSEDLPPTQFGSGAAQGLLEQLLVFEVRVDRHVHGVIGHVRAWLDAAGRSVDGRRAGSCPRASNSVAAGIKSLANLPIALLSNR